MALPRSFKTDESFLEKIAIGATGTRRTLTALRDQGHSPLELERGSTSFKIWKAIKIKRVRVPDILCLKCSHRVESRAKTKMEISMSHSISDPERGWSHGLADDDVVAFVHCGRTGTGPLDWEADTLVQFILTRELRKGWEENLVRTEHPKGAQEGFEVRVTWPSAVASTSGMVEEVTGQRIRFRRSSDRRAQVIQLSRPRVQLSALVEPGEAIVPNQIIAAVVQVTPHFACPGGATVGTYANLAASVALSDRYTAAKALGWFRDPLATDALLERLHDSNEHVYVRVDAAASLMRVGHPDGSHFLSAAMHDAFLSNRLEAIIVLSEVATSEAAEILVATLLDTEQHAEIRAGSAWALGEIGARDLLPILIQGFRSLDLVVRVEAARATAKLARRHLDAVIRELPSSSSEERPGIAWALSKAGGFTIDQLLPALVDDDARLWIAFIIGTQEEQSMLPQIEELASSDPEVYFGIILLWKILASWTYGLEEY